MLWLYSDEEKNKGLVIPLERATARVTKAAGKSGQQKNINRNLANAQEVEGKVSMPPKITLDDSEKCSVLRTYIEYYELNKKIPISHKFLL